MDIDLFKQTYNSTSFSEDAIKERLEYFRLKGHSAQELAVYFFPQPVSRTLIYTIYRNLMGHGYKKVKMERRCIVCEGVLVSRFASSRMHRECRKHYFAGRKKLHSQNEREEEFRNIYRKILRGN